MVRVKDIVIILSGWIQSGVVWGHEKNQVVLYNPPISAPPPPHPALHHHRHEKRSVDVEVLVKAIGSWVPVNQLVCINPILLTLGPYLCFGATAVSALSGLTLVFKSFSNVVMVTTATSTSTSISTSIQTMTETSTVYYRNETTLVKRQEQEEEEKVVTRSRLSSAIAHSPDLWHKYCGGDGGVFGNNGGHVLCGGVAVKRQKQEEGQDEEEYTKQVWKSVIPMVNRFVNATGGDEEAFIDAVFEYNLRSGEGKFAIQSGVFADGDGDGDGTGLPWMVASGVKGDDDSYYEEFEDDEQLITSELSGRISQTMVHDSEPGVVVKVVEEGDDEERFQTQQQEDGGYLMARIETEDIFSSFF